MATTGSPFLGDRRMANRRLLDALSDVWDRVPDQRFGQLIMNLSREPGGFTDTWEWSHYTWYEEMNKAVESWAVGRSDPVD